VYYGSVFEAKKEIPTCTSFSNISPGTKFAGQVTGSEEVSPGAGKLLGRNCKIILFVFCSPAYGLTPKSETHALLHFAGKGPASGKEAR